MNPEQLERYTQGLALLSNKKEETSPTEELNWKVRKEIMLGLNPHRWPLVVRLRFRNPVPQFVRNKKKNPRCVAR